MSSVVKLQHVASHGCSLAPYRESMSVCRILPVCSQGASFLMHVSFWKVYLERRVRQVSASVSWEIRQTVQSSANKLRVCCSWWWKVVSRRRNLSFYYSVRIFFWHGPNVDMWSWVKLEGGVLCPSLCWFCCCFCVLLRFSNLWTADPVWLY